MGLGQYNSLGEYCGPHTASSMFLILVFPPIDKIVKGCAVEETVVKVRMVNTMFAIFPDNLTK